MDPSRLMTQPAVITPRSVGDEKDEYGDDVLIDGDPVELPGGPGQGVGLQQTARAEGARDNTQEETFDLFIPTGIPVDGYTKIEVAGATYELLGPPTEW